MQQLLGYEISSRCFQSSSIEAHIHALGYMDMCLLRVTELPERGKMKTKKVIHEENNKIASDLTRNEPSRSKIVLKKKNRCLKSNKCTQTDTPALVRLNAHEVVRASKYI